MIGSQDLLIGLAIALFFFGAKRLPEIARSLGTSMKEFKRGVSSADDAVGETPRPAVTAPASTTLPPRCVSCQSLLEPDWKHCPRCGASVSLEAGTVPPKAP